MQDAYKNWYDAFSFFNEMLFDGKLPPVLIVMDRSRKKARGTYQAASWISRHDVDAEPVDQIIMNPDYFDGRTDAEILSTFVHEMAHHWQEYFGANRRGSHNKEWGAKMEAIGLPPAPCKPGGKTTGKFVTHEIKPGGAFDNHCRTLIESGHRIEFQVLPSIPKERAAAQRQSKTKFTCAVCGSNAWGKPDTHILCGACSDQHEDRVPMFEADLVDAIREALDKFRGRKFDLPATLRQWRADILEQVGA